MGALNKATHGRDETPAYQFDRKGTPTGGKLPTAPPQVGAKHTAAKSNQVFNHYDEPYRIPAGRPAATATPASNGNGGLRLNGRKIKDRVDQSLAATATDLAINVGGSGLLYADSTNGTDRINIRFATSDGDQAGPLIPLRPGEYIGGERFSRILVTIPNAIAGAVATLLICDDDISDPLAIR